MDNHLHINTPSIEFMQIGESNIDKLQKLCRRNDWSCNISMDGDSVEIEVQHDKGREYPARFESSDMDWAADYALMELGEWA